MRTTVVLLGAAVTLLTGATATQAATQPRPVECNATTLQVSFGASQAGLGHSGVPIKFRNVSQRDCVIQGYPGIAALDQHGHILANAQRTPAGYLGGLTGGATRPPSVLLAPGQTASAMVEGVAPSRSGACDSYAALRVIAPDERHSTTLPFRTDACTRLQVHPAVPGVTGQPSPMPAIPLVDECYPHGPANELQPSSIVLACADANFSAEHLRWDHWLSTHATATGVVSANDCVPYCAAGHFHQFPARFELRRPAVRAGHLVFTQLVIDYTGTRPTGAPKEVVLSL